MRSPSPGTPAALFQHLWRRREDVDFLVNSYESPMEIPLKSHEHPMNSPFCVGMNAMKSRFWSSFNPKNIPKYWMIKHNFLIITLNPHFFSCWRPEGFQFLILKQWKPNLCLCLKANFPWSNHVKSIPKMRLPTCWGRRFPKAELLSERLPPGAVGCKNVEPLAGAVRVGTHERFWKS